MSQRSYLVAEETMMEFEADNSGLPVDHAEMEDVIDMIRVDLPSFRFDDDYLKMLEQHNGGRPAKRDFPVGDDVHTIDQVLNFASVDEADEVTQMLNVSVYWSEIEDRLPIELMPFAVTPGGDALCFEHVEGQRPRVVLWFHELSEEDAPVVKLVADDFSAFTRVLK